MHTQFRLASFALALCCGLVVPTLQAAQTQEATGRVFHDKNQNRRFDEGEPTLGDVRVSNGKQITKTDAQGLYKLPVDDDTILFVIKPRGWMVPLGDDKVPQFYYIHKPGGSPKLKYPGVAPTGPLPASVDFPLYEQEEADRFQMILFGDPQPRDQQEIDYIAHDVVEELVGATEAKLGITLGDIMFNDLSLFGSLNKTIALIGIPWYYVIGNHDINSDADDDKHSDETFESVYGPSYYSFDWGPVHFLCLDDIRWVVEGEKRDYRGGLGPQQMEFIKNDLALLPADQLVVLCMHIPLVDVEDRQELYRLIEKRPFCLSISAHRHFHEHRVITKEDGWQGAEPHHHIINVTACGSWWSGRKDERGIPNATMSDGAPNGYSIITFDGQNYSLRFKAASRPAGYQMNIMAPEELPASKLGETFVYVNVFNGGPRTKVEMRLDDKGPWIELERHAEADPLLVAQIAADKAIANHPWRDLPEPHNTEHLWRGKLPADTPPGTHLIRVRANDEHAHHKAGGDAKKQEVHTHMYRGKRVIRITPAGG